MNFQKALETAPEHVIRTAETREGHTAIQVSGQWFTVHGAAVVPYEGPIKGGLVSPDAIKENAE